MKKQNLLKKQKGITLVALVVTIVVLLILAGISINLVLGQNGIIAKSKEAKNKTLQDQENAQTGLDDASDWIDEQLGVVTLKPFKKDEMLNNTDNTTITIGGKEITIPAGYKIAEDSADTIDEGIVITDAETNGNEWVWVPVSEEDFTKMYVESSSPIAITGGEGKTFVNNVNTSRYTGSDILKYSGITRKKPNSSSYREPDVVVGTGTQYDAVEDNRKSAGFTKTVDGVEKTLTLDEMAQIMIDDYNDMIDSLKKYHGFYIGRYELTGDENNPAEKPGTAKTNETWYTLYGMCKKLAPSGNEKVITRMIYGLQWDATCKWLDSMKDENENKKYDIYGSSKWGNFSDYNTANGYVEGDAKYEANAGKKQPTGLSENWKANNIYDFAGNCYEWTQEASDASSRAIRRRLLQLFNNLHVGNPPQQRKLRSRLFELQRRFFACRTLYKINLKR